ncbi:MAG: ABC transporter substrate-binding protein, partial [Chloroflexi bacterium]|nr:ABC transporter substrate-binding protein [Chloroflexota bacterium]
AVSAQTDRLRMGITGDESTINPFTYVTGSPGWNMLLLQYDTLYQLDSDGVPQPWLVDSLALSDDGLTATLDLREDVTWHDGEAFTAEDVVFTVNYFKEFTTAGRFTRALRPILAAEATGDFQVTMTLADLAPSLELGVFSDVPMMPEHIWADIDPTDESGFDISVNTGTGPYQLVEYQPDQFYRFEAYADYWAGAPSVGELVFIRYADVTGALAALQANEVDMLVPSIPPEQADFLGMTPDIAIEQGPLFTTQMVIYDMTRAPFDIPEVRQAMSLAIDRQDIVETVYLGQATLGNPGWIHPQSAYFNPNIETVVDPAAANALLDETGITDSDGDGIRELDGEPLTVEMVTPSSNALRIRIAELVREMLRDIGIDVQVLVVEQATWEDAVWPGFDIRQGRNYEMAMWGWSAPVQADPIRVSSLVHSDPDIGNLNLTAYNSAAMDELAAELIVTVDAARQTELINEIQALIAEDLPFIMILYPDAVYAYRSTVYDGWSFMSGQGIFHKLSFLPTDARP